MAWLPRCCREGAAKRAAKGAAKIFSYHDIKATENPPRSSFRKGGSALPGASRFHKKSKFTKPREQRQRNPASMPRLRKFPHTSQRKLAASDEFAGLLLVHFSSVLPALGSILNHVSGVAARMSPTTKTAMRLVDIRPPSCNRLSS